MRDKRDRLRNDETHETKHIEHLQFMHAVARFVGPRRLEAQLDSGERQTLTADNIVIATGSRPQTIDIDGLPDDRILTNENIFELRQAPQHLAIVGSGPIAMELAFALRDLGSRVSIITRDDRVFTKAPVAASGVLHDALAGRGIDVCYHATASSYDPLSETLTLETDDGLVQLENVDKVLSAIGRQRNIDNLGLEHAGVKFDPKTGIEVDRNGATNIRGIYAVGDVTPDSHWTHSADAQGRRAVQRIAFPWLPSFGREPLYPNATFSDPEVANVGLMPEEIAKRYHPQLVKTLRFDLAKTDKGYTEGLTRGFIQVSAVRLTGRILGLTIVGPRASEMISFFTLAITEGVSLYKLFRLVYPYPTLSGAVQKIADQYGRETLPHLPAEVWVYMRFTTATMWRRGRGGFSVLTPAGESARQSPAGAEPQMASS